MRHKLSYATVSLCHSVKIPPSDTAAKPLAQWHSQRRRSKHNDR
jgi:hypothetical protein